MRARLSQAALEAELDPDRLSFTEGLFELTEMISLALTVEPEEATEPLLKRLRHKTSSAHQPSGDQADLQQVQTQEASDASTCTF